MKHRSPRQTGFTLVELVVVIVLIGIMAHVGMQFIGTPIQSYVAQTRRAELVDTADTALRLMSRELREALPNSVRVGCSGRCIEMLRAFSGGRYRAAPVDDALRLSFNPADADTRFEVLGPLQNSASIQAGGGSCRDLQTSCLVVFNTGETGSDAYQGDNIASVTALGSGGTTSLDFSFAASGFGAAVTAFPAASPAQRFFLVDTPIAYLCDPAQGTLVRYQGYSIDAGNVQSGQSVSDTVSALEGQTNPAESSLLAAHVSACQFSFTPGTLTRNGLAQMEITVSESGESITLLQQAHVSNVP